MRSLENIVFLRSYHLKSSRSSPIGSSSFCFDRDSDLAKLWYFIQPRFSGWWFQPRKICSSKSESSPTRGTNKNKNKTTTQILVHLSMKYHPPTELSLSHLNMFHFTCIQHFFWILPVCTSPKPPTTPPIKTPLKKKKTLKKHRHFIFKKTNNLEIIGPGIFPASRSNCTGIKCGANSKIVVSKPKS